MNIDTSTPARRAMHRPATLIQPCGRCMNCQDGNPRQCIRFAQADVARATVNDASTGFERAQAALAAKEPDARSCDCQQGDAWRCAVVNNLTTVSCPCVCHRNRPPHAPDSIPDTFTPKSTHNSGNEPLLAFFVACDPTGSTAQQKGVRIVNGKPMFFTKAKVKKAEQQIDRLFAPYAPPVPFAGPLAVEVEFCYPWRKGEAKSVKGHWKCRPKDTIPDVENAFKSVGDQMTKLKFWNDDSQIARLVLVKVWADEPGIRVSIRRCNPVPK